MRCSVQFPLTTPNLSELMSKLHELQQEFKQFLLSGDQRLAVRIKEGGNVSREIRLNIYANAYRQRLKETIDNDHTLLGIYLGDKLFELMVDGYISRHPSNVRSLRYFCDALPQYLLETAPFNQQPLIADLARFERLLLTAFDAADTDTVTLEQLQQLPSEQWPELRLRFHPSTQLFSSDWNTVDTWQDLKRKQTPPPPRGANPSYWLVWRNPERLTEFRSLCFEEYTLLKEALEGCNFAALCETLLVYQQAEMVSETALGYLLGWIEQNIIARLVTREQSANLTVH